MIKALPEISKGFFRWIEAVTELVVRLLERYTTRRVLRFTEDRSGEFVMQAEGISDASSRMKPRIQMNEGTLDHTVSARLATNINGSRVELILQPDRFLFQPLELPSRAAEFLQGIVRTQIDRLTPWNVGDVAFGWSKPRQAELDRIVVTVAATAKAAVKPYVQTMAGLGARSVAIFSCPPQDGAGSMPIKVWEENPRDEAEVRRIRHALVMILAVAGIIAGIATGASALIGGSLDGQQDKLAHQTASIRAQIGAVRPAAADANTSAQAALERRKRAASSPVMILDTLSRILPDTTYVTELRVEGSKLRLVGNTSDAPSLIGLIEQSGRFSKATFFAPTTRSVSEAGERFHIEAIILPPGETQS